MKTFLNLNGFEWTELILLFQLFFILADALAGHSRSGFKHPAQYVPFFAGAPLALCLVIHFVTSMYALLQNILGWICFAVGFLGFLFHYYYGLYKKAKGFQWTLYHLMYGPPLLAPLSLSLSGLIAISLTAGMNGQRFLNFNLRDLLLLLVGGSFAGLLAQTFILHFRGAFKSKFMYIPFTLPLLSVPVILIWLAGHQVWLEGALRILLWFTFISGFIGLGMHLRGFDRQRGGLFLRSFNILEGPPAFAPGLYSTMAAIGLTALYLF
jgi:hypothetical protein